MLAILPLLMAGAVASEAPDVIEITPEQVTDDMVLKIDPAQREMMWTHMYLKSRTTFSASLLVGAVATPVALFDIVLSTQDSGTSGAVTVLGATTAAVSAGFCSLTAWRATRGAGVIAGRTLPMFWGTAAWTLTLATPITLGISAPLALIAATAQMTIARRAMSDISGGPFTPPVRPARQQSTTRRRVFTVSLVPQERGVSLRGTW